MGNQVSAHANQVSSYEYAPERDDERNEFVSELKESASTTEVVNNEIALSKVGNNEKVEESSGTDIEDKKVSKAGSTCSKPIKQNLIDVSEALRRIRQVSANAHGFAGTFQKGLSLVQNLADVSHKCSSDCGHKFQPN